MNDKDYESEGYEKSTKLLSELELAKKKIKRIKRELAEVGYESKNKNKNYKKVFKSQLGTIVATTITVGVLFLVLNIFIFQSKNEASLANDNFSSGYNGTPVQFATTSNNNSSGSSGGSGGGCCGGGSAAATNPAELQKIEAAALDFYATKYGDRNVTVKSQDFGCHIQCNIYKDGELVKELSYRNNQFSEI
ncbi:MAG: hypothetical protein HY776_01225 [Actinobacteria bacterium]|nr:hypothetical protein [Actinomycetota bacterium]